MSDPQLARLDDLGRRFYLFGDPPERFWSVTTIINGGVPKYLGPHYAKMAAELAYHEVLSHGQGSKARAIVNRWAKLGRADVLTRQARGELTSVKLAAPGQPARIKAELTDRDLALRWLKGAADRHRDAAAAKGTAVHDEAEQLVVDHARESSRLLLWALGDRAITPWPGELGKYQTAFVSWITDAAPEFVAAEATVVNRTEAYAGTLDAIIRLPAGVVIDLATANGGNPAASPEAAEVWAWLLSLPPETVVTIIVDYKAGRAIYAEVALQLASYARSEFVAAKDMVTELPMPHVDLGAVLHLRASGSYRFELVRIDQPIYDAFRYAREVFRFTELTARTVFLINLTPRPFAPSTEE